MNKIYESGVTIPTTNKSTRKTTTAIDHILIKSFADTFFKSATFKIDISGYFHICVLISSHEIPTVKEPSDL